MEKATLQQDLHRINLDTPDQEPPEITWETLNLCIGSLFEVMEGRKNFTTQDVAKMLATHGVKVTNLPKRFQENLHNS